MFFGVPNDGLDIDSFIPVVGDGPNRFLLESLGQNNASVLKSQRKRFDEAFSFEGSSEIYCFYETCLSKTAFKVPTCLVSPRCVLILNEYLGQIWDLVYYR